MKRMSTAKGDGHRKGFTLIEIVIVVMVVGILAAIAVPGLSGIETNSKFCADVDTARSIASAAMTAISEGGALVSGGVDSTGNAELLEYLGSGIPRPACGGSTGFTIALNASGTLAGISVSDGTDYVSLWPNPPAAAPSLYQ